MVSDSIALVRHTEIARAWQGRCYGRSDVPLGRAGRTALAPLAARLAGEKPGWVVHGGLMRTRLLAERIAVLAACPLHADTAWQERDFGTWEGQRWTAIYRTSGNAMDGMIDAPAAFRPGGGETTDELAARVMRAWQRLPDGVGIVVTHGGPIAALIGQRQSAPVVSWPAIVPPPGTVVHADR